jgi:hypothetical protein
MGHPCEISPEVRAINTTRERLRAEHEREQYRKLYTLVLYELERLKRQLFGKKAETVDPTQVQLVFGPVFDALARAEQGDEGAQDDVRAEFEKLKAAADKAKAEAEANKPKRDKNAKATVAATSTRSRHPSWKLCSSRRSGSCPVGSCS